MAASFVSARADMHTLNNAARMHKFVFIAFGRLLRFIFLLSRRRIKFGLQTGGRHVYFASASGNPVHAGRVPTEAGAPTVASSGQVASKDVRAANDCSNKLLQAPIRGCQAALADANAVFVFPDA